MKRYEKFVGKFGDGFVVKPISGAFVCVHPAEAIEKIRAVSWPERRKQEPFSRWPSVAKNTPPSRFQTVRLGTLGAFFLGVSGWLMRSSMRDCGGGQASALVKKNTGRCSAQKYCARHGLCEHPKHQFGPGFEFTAGRGLRRRKEISPT